VTDTRSGLPLPHAYPFLLLDRIVSVHVGHHAEALKQLTREDPVLDGSGCLAPTLLAEVLAQCAGIAAAGSAGGSGVLVKIDRFRARARIAGGHELRVRVDILKTLGTMLKARGTVRADGRLCAAGDLVLQVQHGVAKGDV